MSSDSSSSSSGPVQHFSTEATTTPRPGSSPPNPNYAQQKETQRTKVVDHTECLTISYIDKGNNRVVTGIIYNWETCRSIKSATGVLSEVPVQPSELTHESLSLVRDIELIIPWQATEPSATEPSLLRLKRICRVIADSLMPGIVHLTVSCNDFCWSGDGCLEPLESFSRLASLKVVRGSEKDPNHLCRSFFPTLIEPPPVPSRTPFPFLRLPVELQDMVLARSDAISQAPFGVNPSLAYRRLNMHFPCCGQCSQRDPSFCWCTKNGRYSSTCVCRP